jgi:hypothetical protein
MRLTHQQLLRLPVETASGLKLGVVAAFEVDAEQQVVACYYVRASLLARPFARELVVAASQVVSLSAARMVVADSVAPTALAAATPVPTV